MKLLGEGVVLSERRFLSALGFLNIVGSPVFPKTGIILQFLSSAFLYVLKHLKASCNSFMCIYFAMLIKSCVRALPANSKSLGSRLKLVLKILVIVSSKIDIGDMNFLMRLILKSIY